MTKMEYLEQICTAMGIDTSALPDRLTGTYLEAILTAIGSGGGGGASPELLARIEALEGRVEALEPGNLFNIAAVPNFNKDVKNGREYIHTYGVPDWSIPILEVCPDLKKGNTYTISLEIDYDAQGFIQQSSPRVEVGYDTVAEGIGRHSYTFEYDGEEYMTFYANIEEDEELIMTVCPTYFYDIMINEGTEPLPWKPYKG